jgi:hypothetical protein
MKSMEDVNNEAAQGDSQESAQPADEIKNIKAEFSRKFSNLEETNKALLEQLKALSSKPAAQAEAKPGKKIADVWYDSPEEAAHMIQAQAEANIKAELAKNEQHKAKYQAVTNQLYHDYPELSDPSGQLMSRAQEIYKTLPDDERSTAVAMKSAVLDAAMELGIKPKKQRSKNDDSFALGGSSSSTSGRTAQTKMDADMESAQRYLAAQFGIDYDNKEVKERIKSKHGRATYTKWDRAKK